MAKGSGLQMLLTGATLLGMLLTGCGGGESAKTATPSTGRGGTLSQDALILASRTATGPRIPTEQGEIYENDLRKIRERYPEVAEIHARPEAALDEVLVGLAKTAPWYSAWIKGDTTTGEPEIDSLLTEFHISGIRRSLENADTGYFRLNFSQPLNPRAMAERLKSLQSAIRSAEPNYLVGDGDNITFTAGTDNQKVYTFSKGWGDCLAGCTSRHNWIFTLTGEAIQKQESGDSLPE